MQLSKEEYARKRIHNGSSVQIENSVTRVTVRNHEARQVMPTSYPREGIFSRHLTTIKDFYNLTHVISPKKENFHVNSVCIDYIGRHVALSLGWRHCDVTMMLFWKMSHVSIIACGIKCYF